MIIGIIFLYSLIFIHFVYSMLIFSSCFALKHVWVGRKSHEHSKFVMLCGTTGRQSSLAFLSIFDIAHEHVSNFFLHILFVHVRAYCKQEKHFNVSYNGVKFGFNFKVDFIRTSLGACFLGPYIGKDYANTEQWVIAPCTEM